MGYLFDIQYVYFNFSHILSVVSLPIDELLDYALSNLEPTRDIYIYNEAVEETATVA